MSLNANNLAPWERKKEYYSNIQLGKDVKTQTEILSRQTKAMHEAQLAQTSATIVSQERISEGIDSLGYGIDNVTRGIAGLQASFEWGISEVVWQIEQNRKELRNILEVLSAPLDTQAKELRKRAEEAYANGWFEDALTDFFESEEKNRYDFSIHISIGMIYLFNQLNREKALEYFDKAIKYASPKSNYYTSFALLHKALIKRDFGVIEESENCARKAIELSPDFAEAVYQCAQYNAMLNRPEEVIHLLERAILLDTNYCEKVSSDEVFDQFRPQINKLFENLRRTEGDKARKNLEVFSNLVNEFECLLEEIQNIVEVSVDKLHACTARITECMHRNSYRDYLEVNRRLIRELQSIVHRLRLDSTSKLSLLVQSYGQDISRIVSEKNTEVSNTDNLYSWILPFGSVVSLFLGLRGCWVRGPGAPEAIHRDFIAELFSALGALIWIPAVGIFITWVIYKIVTEGVKSSSASSANSQIARVKPTVARLEEFIKNISASDEYFSSVVVHER